MEDCASSPDDSMKLRYIAVSIASMCLLSNTLGAQTQIDASQLRSVDLTRVGTILFRTGADVPTTCSAGEALLKTDAPSGLNLYVCLSPNTWVLQGPTETFTATALPGAVPVANGSGKIAQEWIDFSGYQETLGFTPLNRAANLSDVASPSASRASLGLGPAALKGVQGTGAAVAAFGGGITIANDCVIFDGVGNLADSGAPCGGSGNAGAANYAQAFSAQTSVALTHNANTTSILVQCFDAANNVLIPNSMVLTNPNTATVGFATAQSGNCVVNSSGGGSQGVSSFAQLLGVASILQGGTGQSTKVAAFDALAPGTSKGDMIVFDGMTHARAGVGADGSCWIADSAQAAGVRWGPCSGVTSGAGVTLVGNVVSVDSTTVPTFLMGAASLVFGAIPNGACDTRTFPLTGAATADGIAAGWPSTLETGLVGMFRVSAANSVEVRLCNLSGAAITPAPGQTFRATIVRSF
jgi:hypothetical protein